MKIYIILIFVLSSISGLNSTTQNGVMKCKERERHALLTFKQSVQDHHGMLSTWKEGPNEDCCKWMGVQCNNQTGNVQSLDLHGSYSKYLSGEINPSIAMLQYLKYLDLSFLNTSGQIPIFICSFSKLQYLNLSHGFYNGVIPSHLGNLSQLQQLDLSYNELSGAFPFQIGNLLQLQHLNLRRNELSGAIPFQLGNILQLETLGYMDISNNNLTGRIPNLELNLTMYPTIDFSSNKLEGPIPSFLLQAGALDLSDNKFSDLVSFLCNKNNPSNLGMFDISNNELKGELPDCWSSLTSLEYVDMSNNKLSGNIPFSMGSLVNMEALILRNNSLSGQLTSSLKNCSNKLAFLNLGENMFVGQIPSWIGDSLPQLVILSLRLNNFYGNIPSNLCYLRNIRVLDLSLNNLSGRIPSCVQNFTSIAQNFGNSTTSMEHEYSPRNSYYIRYYVFNLFLMWKGKDRTYKNADRFLKVIDLSSNHLTGEIPTETEYLIGLTSLNLSRNNLSGEIISNIGNLKSLEFLDLSRNHLSGRIPSSLTHIDRLTMLDFSNNELDGKIPIGTQLQTFNASSFEGNSNLCGEPLDRKCPGEEMSNDQVPTTDDAGDDNSVFLEALYMSMGIGFFTGFVGLVGSIFFVPSWKETYSRLLNKLILTVFMWWKE